MFARRLWEAALAALAIAAAAGCSGGGGGGSSNLTVPDAGDDSPPPQFDAGSTFTGPGPWPTAPLTLFDGTQGLDPDVVDVSTDEDQNIWAVSHNALYLLQPGQKKFKQYTDADGLHVANAMYPGITAVAGGGPGEVFVGYQGTDVIDPQKDPQWMKDKGKVDRVLLQPDGKLKVTHYDVHNNDAVGFDAQGNVILGPNGFADPQYTDWSFHEDRSVKRFLYDHIYHRGTLYVGYNHGVARFEAGHIDPVTSFDYADHLHPVVYNDKGTQRMGDWRGLAIDPAPRKTKSGEWALGTLWVGGRWTGGAITWTPSLFAWARNELNPFWQAFSGPPIWPVNNGDDIYIDGIAPLSDGSVFFASGQGNAQGFSARGLAHWLGGKRFEYLQPHADLSLPNDEIVDLQRLPDDTLLLSMDWAGVWRWNPRPFPKGLKVAQISGLPSMQVRRIYVDAMVVPTAVYLATPAGAVMLRLP